MRYFYIMVACVFICAPVYARDIYVANETGHDVAVITTTEDASGKIVLQNQNRIPLGVYAPHNLIISQDKRFLYVTANDHGDSHHMGRLFKIDLSNKKQSYFEQSGHFAHVAEDSSRGLLFLADTAAGRILVIKAKDMTLHKTIAAGKGPHGLKFNTAENKLHVANMGGDAISQINLADNVSKEIQVGFSPVQIALSSIKDRIYTTLFKEKRIAVINTSTGHVDQYIPAIDSPVQIEESADGKFLVAAEQGTKENPGKTIIVVDPHALDQVKHIAVGRGPHGVALSGHQAFITNLVDHSLSVVDLDKGIEVLRVPDLSEPNGVAVLE